MKIEDKNRKSAQLVDINIHLYLIQYNFQK